MPALMVPAEHPSLSSRSPSLSPNLFRCDVPQRAVAQPPRERCCLGMWSVEMVGGGLWENWCGCPCSAITKAVGASAATPSTRYFPFLVKWGRDAKLHLCGTEAEVLASISLLVLLQKKKKSVLLLLKMNEMQNGWEEENEEMGWRGRAMAGSCWPVPSEMKLWKHWCCAGGGILASWSIWVIRLGLLMQAA